MKTHQLRLSTDLFTRAMVVRRLACGYRPTFSTQMTTDFEHVTCHLCRAAVKKERLRATKAAAKGLSSREDRVKS
jgi:hypothetical protein